MSKKPDLRILGLGDEKLMERLQKAAEAAGLETVEQLVDLAIDSGVSARPPADYLTERFTLEDLGERLRLVVATTPRSSRAEWFSKLAEVQQKAVVTVLRQRGYAAHVIANDLGIKEAEVASIYASHVTELGSQVLGVRLDTLAGHLLHAKERAQQMAQSKNDAGAFWRIEKDFVGVLQDLGVVKRAAHRVEMVNKAEDIKANALARLVQIAEKKALRSEELKQLTSEEFDVLPETVAAEVEDLRGMDHQS